MKLSPACIAPLLWLCAVNAGHSQVLGDAANRTLERLDQRALDREISGTLRRLPEVKKPLNSALEEAENTADAAGNELGAVLPDNLPILDISGAIAFREVVTESGFRAVQQEWLAVITPDDVASLSTGGVEVLAQKSYPALGLTTARLRVPASLDNSESLRRALGLDADAELERNYIYTPQRKALSPGNGPTANIAVGAEGSGASAEGSSPNAEGSSPNAEGSVCSENVRVGMIDTAIREQHPAFTGSQLVTRSFVPPKLPAATAHGTAVAGLLVGRGPELTPLLVGGTVYAASIFYARDAYSQGATLAAMLDALQWLADQQVSVINMSLGGPPNRLLARAVHTLAQRQMSIVAAVGNEGPAAPPLYPAAYPDAVAVTAVDREKTVYRWANRGDHVDFAAPGVQVITARSDGDFGRESGTSMATPVVSALIACGLAEGNRIEKTLKKLVRAAEDLGKKGRDPVYGHGLLHHR